MGENLNNRLNYRPHKIYAVDCTMHISTTGQDLCSANSNTCGQFTVTVLLLVTGVHGDKWFTKGGCVAFTLSKNAKTLAKHLMD